jgi:hypothetical protein
MIMKPILRILIILLTATVVAGAFSLAVNNSSIASDSNSAGQPPALISSDGQSTTLPMARPEGGERDGGSITGGLSEVLVTLSKLTGISLVVLFIQKAFSLFEQRKLIPTRR